MTHKEIAKLIVDAEIRIYGRCKTKTTIQLKQWVYGLQSSGDFFTHDELVSLNHCALYIECYNAMKQEVINEI